jgi:hypothetical protein
MSTHRRLPTVLVAAAAMTVAATACSGGGDEGGLVLDGPADAGVPAVDPADPVVTAATTDTAPADTATTEPTDGPIDPPTGTMPTDTVPTGAPTTEPVAPPDAEDLADLGATRIGEGAARVTVGGVAYEAEAQICIAEPSSFTFSGPATGSDGTAAWVEVDRSVLTRAEAEENFDEATVDLLLGDADLLDDTSIAVTVGRTELLAGGPVDQPAWEAYAGSIGDDLDVEIDGGTLRATGVVRDVHGIGAPIDATVPIELEATCR